MLLSGGGVQVTCRNKLDIRYLEQSINSFLSNYTPLSLSLSLSLDLYCNLLLQTNSLSAFFLLGGHSDYKNNQQASSQAGKDGCNKSTKVARVY